MPEINEEKLAEILDQATKLEELGDEQLNSGDLEKAKDSYLQGLQLLENSGFPFDSIAEKKGLLVYSLAIALMRLEELEEAFKQFHEAIAIFNRLDSYPTISASSFYNLGIIVRQREEYELAIENFQKALKIWDEYQDEKNMKDTLEALGDTYRYSGRPEEAINWYQGWFNLIDKETAPAEAVQPLRDLGAVYSDNKELEKAVEAYLEALRLYETVADPDPSTMGSLFLSLGNAYSNSGEFKKAIEAHLSAEKFYESNPDPVQRANPLHNIGNEYRKLEDWEKAVQYYFAALELYKQSENPFAKTSTLNCLGHAFSNNKEPDNAIEHYVEALDLFKEESNTLAVANTLYNLGNEYRNSSDMEAAATNYLEALKLYKEINPDDVLDALKQLNKVYTDMDRKDQAIDIFNEGLLFYDSASYPQKRAQVLHNIGIAHTNLSREYDKALEAYSEALDLYSGLVDKANILHNMGNVLKRQMEFEKALERYLEARRNYEEAAVDPIDLVDTIQEIGLCHSNLKRPEKALEFYTEAGEIIDQHEGSPLLKAANLVYIGSAYGEMGEIRKAREHYMPALEYYDPKTHLLGRAQVLYNLGWAFRTRGDLETATEYYLEALALYKQSKNPLDQLETLDNLGFVYRDKRELDEALEYYSQAESLAEKYDAEPHRKAAVEHNLGLVYRDRKEWDKALESFLPALDYYDEKKYTRDRATILTNIGHAYLNKKELAKAEQYCLDGLALYEKSLNPRDKCNCLNYLGTIYRRMGQLEQGMDSHLQALTLHEESPNPFDIAETLKEISAADENMAISYALRSPLGRFWLYSQYQDALDKDEGISGKLWTAIWQASALFWEDMQELQAEEALESSEYRQNWKLDQLVNSISQKITSETLINFLVGANDLDAAKGATHRELRSEQRSLMPLWFVEFPLQLIHGSKYLKIRLNDTIWRDGEYVGYPLLDGEAHHIERIELHLETQWLQRIEIDHLFYPNSQEEQEAFKKDPESTWLTDVHVIDLEDHLKKEANLELAYSLNIYFDATSSQPDIRTTTKRHIVPILRTRNYERVERWIKNHNNALAVTLAAWSIVISAALNLPPMANDVGPMLTNTFGSGFLLGLAILLSAFLSLSALGMIFWSIRGINRDKQTDRMQKHRDVIGELKE
ncbi:MAG: tetratricopeptide repeat protein [Candidatus Hodarchaeales archaeon]|jgi:tetratricopeptide (TPR) repeat protein